MSSSALVAQVPTTGLFGCGTPYSKTIHVLMENPDLHDFAFVMVNSSAGKDSQTALRRVVRMADEVGYPRDRIVVFHADLGHVEWSGTKDLAKEQAEHYGLRLEVAKYQSKDGEQLTLLDYVRRRKKWFSPSIRFCTSEYKRGPGGRTITKLSRELTHGPHKVLNVLGLRAEESPARAKKKPLVLNARQSTKPKKGTGVRNKEVWDWLPIQDWKLDDVWGDIHESGVRHHYAYDLGMPRLSCCFCIYAPPAALILAGKHNLPLLDEYIEVEKETGHTFWHNKSLSTIKEAIEAGVEPAPSELHGAWNM